MLEISRALEVYLVLGNDFPQSTTEKQQQAKITPTLTSPNSNAFKGLAASQRLHTAQWAHSTALYVFQRRGLPHQDFRTQEEDFASKGKRLTDSIERETLLMIWTSLII